MVRWDAGSTDGALTLNRIVDARLPRALTAGSCLGISLVINPVNGVPMIALNLVDELQALLTRQRYQSCPG
jgi:hypothetical protein